MYTGLLDRLLSLLDSVSVALQLTLSSTLLSSTCLKLTTSQRRSVSGGGVGGVLTSSYCSTLGTYSTAAWRESLQAATPDNRTSIVICNVLVMWLLPLSSLPQRAALSEYRPILPNRSQSRNVSMADVKLTLIPIIFIVLRIWSTVRFILLLVDSPFRQNPVLVTLHVSRGDSE